MDNLEVINLRVQQQLSNKSKDIVLIAYQSLINSHNELCGCEYCKLLKDYIWYKKLKCRLNRAVEYNFPCPETEMQLMRTISTIKNLKIQKDSLKQLKLTI